MCTSSPTTYPVLETLGSCDRGRGARDPGRHPRTASPDPSLRQDQLDEQPVTRLAIERLWITAANLAEIYRMDQGLATGTEPWAELVGYRNLLAHALPGDISSDRVFADSTTDLARILDQVRRLTR